VDQCLAEEPNYFLQLVLWPPDHIPEVFRTASQIEQSAKLYIQTYPGQIDQDVTWHSRALENANAREKAADAEMPPGNPEVRMCYSRAMLRKCS
jgi:hypothetical protein